MTNIYFTIFNSFRFLKDFLIILDFFSYKKNGNFLYITNIDWLR